MFYSHIILDVRLGSRCQLIQYLLGFSLCFFLSFTLQSNLILSTEARNIIFLSDGLFACTFSRRRLFTFG